MRRVRKRPVKDKFGIFARVSAVMEETSRERRSLRKLGKERREE